MALVKGRSSNGVFAEEPLLVELRSTTERHAVTQAIFSSIMDHRFFSGVEECENGNGKVDKPSRCWEILKKVDLPVGILWMCGWFYVSVGKSFATIWTVAYHTIFVGEWRNAYSLFEVVREGELIIMSTLLVFLWASFCFNLECLHKLWKRVLPGQKNPLMTTGFVLRPSAYVLGLVLFLTGAVLQETQVVCANGERFTAGTKWPFEMQCWAAEVKQPNLLAVGYRNTYSWDQSALDQCFKKGSAFSHADIEMVTGQTFNQNEFSANKTLLSIFSGSEDMKCIYRCVKWQQFGLDSIVKNIGVIGAGAVFVVTLISTISQHVGWKMVTAETTPQDLKRILSLNGVTSSGGLTLLAALQLTAVGKLSNYSALYVNSAGPGTASFLVTKVVILGLLNCLLIRMWCPFRMHPIIYTADLWNNGRDTLLHYNPKTAIFQTVTVDLYEWLHFSKPKRAYLLTLYARKVSQEDMKHSKKDIEVVCLRSFETNRIVVHKLRDGEDPVVSLHPVKVPIGSKGVVLSIDGEDANVEWDIVGPEGNREQATTKACYLIKSEKLEV